MTWGMPGLLLTVIGAGLIAGVGARWFALAAAAVMVWFMMAKLPGATGVIGWFNAVKREFAILAAAGVIASAGGARMFTLDKALDGLSAWWATYGSARPPETARRSAAE